jgi:hypothetical protein
VSRQHARALRRRPRPWCPSSRAEPRDSALQITAHLQQPTTSRENDSASSSTAELNKARQRIVLQ